MTRINTVCPMELTNRHLLAEYIELPRIFSYAKLLECKGIVPETFKRPDHYVLGTGHQKFFTNKLFWLECRFLDIVSEMQRRGIKTTYPQTNPRSKPQAEGWYGDWSPTPEAVELNRRRIAERIAAKPHLYKDVI